MSPVRVTFRRTIGQARSLYTAALACAGFLAAAAVLFAFNLDAAEGCRVRLVPLWTVSVAPALPILAALLGMDVWSDERKTGRIDLLLAAPVRERDFVIGKFLGVWAMTLVDIAIALATSIGFIEYFAPALMENVSFASFLPGVFALAMQSALWSAVAVAMSALFRNPAASAVATAALLSAIPRGLWYALMAWAPEGRPRFGEMPLDAQAYDIASGLVSTGTVVAYAVLAVSALFLASKAVASLRCPGRGGRGLLASTRTTVALGIVSAVLAVALAYRLDVVLDLPIGGREARFSPRTRSILAESRGTVEITAFLERGDGRFRPLSHFLRALVAEADAMCGVRIEVRYVDPTLDLGAASRLVREGVERDSLVFEQDGRIVGRLRLADGYGERACVSLIERVTLPFQRSCVYWTTGHGEASTTDYGPDGLSDIARDLALDGYGNKTIDLAGGAAIADDCALVVVAGARNDFSVVELNRLRSYLEGRGGKNEGGRLLVLLDTAHPGGIPTLLTEWGIRPVPAALSGTRTLSGTDVVVSDFEADHVVSAPFAGQRVVLDAPVAFVPSAAADESGTGADRKRYSPLLKAGGATLAAAVERGEERSDLAIRPTRIVAIGDVGFSLNAHLAAFANANRDFILNSVKYLSGRDALTQAGTEPDLLVSGMDRTSRARLVVASGLAFPALVFLLMAAGVARRRNR